MQNRSRKARLLTPAPAAGSIVAAVLRRLMRIWLRSAALTGACLLAPIAGPAAAAPIPSSQPPLALTPYMGVDTWYAFGTKIDENVVTSLADAMVSRGLVAAGYNYLWIDAGWWSGARDADGKMAVSATQWPHGMSWLTGFLHARGLRAGIYTDAGSTGCAQHAGSYGHYQTDVNTFAAWGFDAIKLDFCGGHQLGLNPGTASREFAAAIAADSPHRAILFNFCDAYVPGRFGPGQPPFIGSAYASHLFAGKTANSWRTSADIGNPGAVTFAGVLSNLDWDAMWPYAAGPGHWNDPDYLVPDAGMTPSQAQVQFSLWTIVAAPLMLSDDVRSMPAATLSMLTKPEVLAISQDQLGVQGWLARRRGAAEVWVKALANGDRAVALLNRGPTPVAMRATTKMIGMPAARRYDVRDVWAQSSSTVRSVIQRTVPANSAYLLRVTAR
jgi:alpha-galactosidase